MRESRVKQVRPVYHDVDFDGEKPEHIAKWIDQHGRERYTDIGRLEEDYQHLFGNYTSGNAMDMLHRDHINELENEKKRLEVEVKRLRSREGRQLKAVERLNSAMNKCLEEMR